MNLPLLLMPTVKLPRPPTKQSEVREKCGSAKQIQLIHTSDSKQHLHSDLVAEPRCYNCSLRYIGCFVMTMLITILAISTTTTDVEPNMIRDATMFSTILATTTATSTTVTDYGRVEGSTMHNSAQQLRRSMRNVSGILSVGSLTRINSMRSRRWIEWIVCTNR